MLPVETIRAIYPRDGAVTLAHCAALEALGVSLDAPLTEADAPLAMWVLTLSPSRCSEVVRSGYAGFAFRMWRAGFRFRAWAGKVSPRAVLNNVDAVLSEAFANIVPAKTEGNAQVLRPTGFGWPLEMAEWYMAEYGATFDEAFQVPLARLFSLIACARVRNGGKNGGPDYYERIDLAEMKLAEMKERADG